LNNIKRDKSRETISCWGWDILCDLAHSSSCFVLAIGLFNLRMNRNKG